MAQPLPLSEPSSLPEPRLYTIADYLALGEFEGGYSELFEGRLIVVPGPSMEHNMAGIELITALRRSLPTDLVCCYDVDIDLELASPGSPGFSRRPDVVVVHRSARDRVRDERGMVKASEVVLVIEIVSPSSVRTDNVVKRGEYADAGIPYYWIVDLTEPVSVLACHQAGAFGYADGGEVTGVLRVAEPFPAEIDLAGLG
ncbi:MAG: Uma2 family endonuclease [Pseudonocardia sp.]